MFATGKVALGDFESLIAARSFDASAEQFADFAALETYLDATGGAVMRLAIQVLGGNVDLAREAALAFGLAGLIRSLPFHAARHKLYVPPDLLAATELTPDQFFSAAADPRQSAVARQMALRARDHFLAARRGPRPGAALPALLPAALVPVYLKRLSKVHDVPLHRKQMALLSAAMKKRL